MDCNYLEESGRRSLQTALFICTMCIMPTPMRWQKTASLYLDCRFYWGREIEKHRCDEKRPLNYHFIRFGRAGLLPRILPPLRCQWPVKRELQRLRRRNPRERKEARARKMEVADEGSVEGEKPQAASSVSTVRAAPTPEELVARAVAPVKREFLCSAPQRSADRKEKPDKEFNEDNGVPVVLKEKKSKRQLKRERQLVRPRPLNFLVIIVP